MPQHESLPVRLRNLTASDNGFTLIEVLAVMVIVGLLAAIAIPQIGKFRERAYVTSLKSDARTLVNEAEGVYADTREYPLAAPDVDLSPHNVVAWGAPNENGVNFVITNTKVNKSVTVVNNRISGVTDGGVNEGEEGEETNAFNVSYTVNPSTPTSDDTPFEFITTVTPANTEFTLIEMWIDDQDLGGFWMDVTGMLTFTNGQTSIPAQTTNTGVWEIPVRFTTAGGSQTVTFTANVN